MQHKPRATDERKGTGVVALLAGGTGLVGGHLLRQLASDARYVSAIAVTRRASGLAGGKVQEQVVDFGALAGTVLPKADVGFCALGTTMRAAGSKEAFARVDRDAVVAFAQGCKAAGVKTFVLVSSMGAKARSSVFYNAIKGQTEEALGAINFESLVVLRPSLLVGSRTEKRPLERLGVAFAPVLRALLVAPFLRNFAPIDGSVVAAAMREAPFAAHEDKGLRVLLSGEINAFAPVT